MYEGKPIIGLSGGIGSGKSHVAKLFAAEGWFPIESDRLVDVAYTHPKVCRELADWMGPEVFDDGGRVRKGVVADRVFNDPVARKRLESLLHPAVNLARVELMRRAARDVSAVGYVWDSPLLFETGLDAHCDATVFVDAPEALRARRVLHGRGWGAEELLRREKSQWPLDKKRSKADYHVTNDADNGGSPDADATLRDQVRRVSAEVLAAGVGPTPD